ncbi:HNH endonuclease [Pedobacter namyangjuensis]|uniref:HNH endonuclease n=1 Tax=Pedobacter namyangjuensis TaxID=600626 RepID=UPI000DE4B6BB|nr:HNH endonuclease [Pedobacter namyangjuensis]
MLNPILQKYGKAFSSLKRGGTKYGLAPHKPVLLISLIELIEKGLVTENKISVNADLVGTFKENWQLLVPTLYQPDFTQPFYYLQSEKAQGNAYWFLQPKPGCQINAHIKSVNTLQAVCAYGYFGAELFLLLSIAQERNILLQNLLDTYFPQQKASFLQAKNRGDGYLHEQVNYVLNEPEAIYKHVSKYTEEDVFVRNGLFKKLVPKLYQNQCSFTGMALTSIYNYNFIDACHIVPFSVSHNDKVANGIALCPNMHRAFDRGLLSIDENYCILVSENLTEDKSHPYALGQLKGKNILLPQQQNHYPAQEALAWHRVHRFKT